MVILGKFHHILVFLKTVHQLVMHLGNDMPITTFKAKLLEIDHDSFPKHPTQIVKHYHDAWWIHPSQEMDDEPEYHILDGAKLKDFITQVIQK